MIQGALNFGGDPDHHADCPIGDPVITQQNLSSFFNEIIRIAL